MIAILIGGIVMVVRHADDWTRPSSAERDTPPLYRSLAITLARPFQLLEWRIYDFIHEFGAKTPEDPEVVVLGIDEASLSLEDSSAFPEDIQESRALQLMDEVFPWSREVYALMIERLVEAGAKTVVIDLMFPAASGSHPEGDAVLRRCLEKYREHVILAADLVAREIQNGRSESVALPTDGLIPRRWPVDDRIGFVSYWPDSDGVIRETQFHHSLDPGLAGRTLDSFAASTLRSQGLTDRVPTDFGFHFVRFGDPSNYEPVSLHEIFIPSIWESNLGSGKRFAGKTVFLGTVAGQLQDFHLTPVGKIAGVRIHAHVYAATKAGQLLHRPPAWASPLMIAVASGLAGLLVSLTTRPLLGTALLLGSATLFLLTQFLLFNHASLIINASTPVFAFAGIGLFGFTYDFLLERNQKLALKRSVMRFHSPDVAEQIVQHPESYHSIRQGAVRCIVVLFSDIRGYTRISEQLSAEQMVAQLNEYFESMVSIVFQRRGAVDKFIGDAMMAVWGRFRDTPQEQDLAQDACQAVDAALAMRAGLATLNCDWAARNMTELSIGIGIHQGEAVVGEIGSSQRTELTAIGDAVNIGSRLEGATKEYGLDLIISEAVRNRVAQRFLCRSVDLLRVKGKTRPIEVFTVLGPITMTPVPGLSLFEKGMAAYRHGQFHEAFNLLQQAAQEGLNDALTATFIQRSSDLIKTPPEAWDGVYAMTQK
ncbi:MAG: adenylate/guanylate cyclase domain-containing protein [Verrucomicrobiota bacterium]